MHRGDNDGAMSDLKRALGTEGKRLVATPDTICFDPVEAEIDVLAFDGHSAKFVAGSENGGNEMD